MKLSKLFVIALLAGTLGVFGCSDDPPSNGNGNGGSGGDGNGGSGGTAVDPCTSGDCADSSSDVQATCNAVVTYCNSDDCCELPGAGGSGGTMMIDPTAEECDAAGQAICEIAGAGGAGGTGGTGVECPDFTGDQVCATCDVPADVPTCLATFADCLVPDPTPVQCEKCAVVAISECNGV